MSELDFERYPDLQKAFAVAVCIELIKMAIPVVVHCYLSGKTGSMSLTSPPMIAGSTPAPDTKAAECT